jgi:antitoxin YefM
MLIGTRSFSGLVRNLVPNVNVAYWRTKEFLTVITASEARSRLFPLMEQVNTDSTPILITSKKGNAVLVSESEWEAIIETMYVLRTTANREQLAKSQAEVLSGNLFEYELPITTASRGKKPSRPVKKTLA